MFHLTDGLYFEQLPEGAVRIIKTDGGREDSPVIFDLTVDANAWSSVIASMSHYGEENGGFYRALNFHRGDPIPPGVRKVEGGKWASFTAGECDYDPAQHDKPQADPGPLGQLNQLA